MLLESRRAGLEGGSAGALEAAACSSLPGTSGHLAVLPGHV